VRGMEILMIIELFYYLGIVNILFALLLFVGFKKASLLNSRTAMIPAGILLVGAGMTTSLGSWYIIGFLALIAGGIFFVVGWILQVRYVMRNKRQ
jgi:hypothetical protein